MKKTSKTKATNKATTNVITATGIITFVRAKTKKDGSTVWGYTIGVKVPYTVDGKEFTAYPSFELNTTEHGEPEKGDNVVLTAHYETHKYTNKDSKDVYTTTAVVDTIE